MGQKISPHSIRLGINKDWNSKWYPPTNKDWTKWLLEDIEIRKYFSKKERVWSIGEIVIEKTKKYLHIFVHTARPGIVLGDGGKNIDNIQKDISKLTKKINMELKNRVIKIEVIEIVNPDLSAKIVANEIAIALENRSPFRTAQKFAIRKVMKSGAKGIKTKVSGRLGGVDMARSEGYTKGVVPLQTFRHDIDYASVEADTTYGKLGVKVWISKGEILNKKVMKKEFQNKKVGG